MKTYKLVEFLLNLNVKPPLHERKAPPIDGFLATVLLQPSSKWLRPESRLDIKSYPGWARLDIDAFISKLRGLYQ